jgi:hypothetical protein
MEDDIKATG